MVRAVGVGHLEASHDVGRKTRAFRRGRGPVVRVGRSPAVRALGQRGGAHESPHKLLRGGELNLHVRFETAAAKVLRGELERRPVMLDRLEHNAAVRLQVLRGEHERTPVLLDPITTRFWHEKLAEGA